MFRFRTVRLLMSVVMVTGAYYYLQNPRFVHFGLMPPDKVETASAEEVAGKLRSRLASRLYVLGRGKVVDFEVYHNKRTINVYLKVRTSRLLMGDLPEELESGERVRMRTRLARALCPYLQAAKGVRNLDISVVKEDMTDSVSFKIYRGECTGGA